MVGLRQLLKVQDIKFGHLFEGTKNIVTKTGKLVTKHSPVGSFLSAAVIYDEVYTDTWNAHTIVNGTLLGVTLVATYFAVPVILTGVGVYGVGDYFFDFSETIDSTVGRKLVRTSGKW